MTKLTVHPETGKGIKRETAAAVQGRPLAVELRPHAALIWRKGARDAVLVPWEAIYQIGHTAPGLRLPARRGGRR